MERVYVRTVVSAQCVYLCPGAARACGTGSGAPSVRSLQGTWVGPPPAPPLPPGSERKETGVPRPQGAAPSRSGPAAYSIPRSPGGVTGQEELQIYKESKETLWV